MPAIEHHDVVVIGGGTAGVSAALECHDIQLDVVLLEASRSLGGQLDEIGNSIRNVAAGTFENGSALRQELEASAAILGDRVNLSHRVTEANLEERWVDAGGRRLTAGAIVVAVGSVKQQLAAVADGAFDGAVTSQIESWHGRFDHSAVAVMGGGDSATLDALQLARAGASVMLFHRSDALSARQDIVEAVRAQARIEDLAGWDLDEVHGTGGLEEVVVARRGTGERRTLEVAGLLIKISRTPATGFLKDAVTLDRRGGVLVDHALRSSVPGVFAAGDAVAEAYARIAAAMGQGVLAARSCLRYLQGRQ